MLKKLLFIAFTLTALSEAKSIEVLIEAFQDKNFKLVCQDGMKKYHKGNRDEDFLGMVGVACAEIDYINPLGILQKSLKATKAGRNNASYFSTLILQKKLLYQFMVDGIDIGYLRLPDTGHILSRIFKSLVLEKYETISKSNPKKLKISDSEGEIVIYTSNDRVTKVIVDVMKNGRKVATHWYR